MSASTHPQNWLSIAVYYHCKSWHHLILNSIKPAVDSLISRKQASQYILLKSHDRGDHVKIMIKGTQDVLQEEVLPFMEEEIKKFLLMYPTQDPKVKLPVKSLFINYPNNSIQVSKYVNMSNILGGAHAAPAAEWMSYISSDIIFEILKNSNVRSIEQANGIAYFLLLSFLHELNMDLQEAQAFIDASFVHTFPNIAQLQVKNKQDEKKKDKLSIEIGEAASKLKENFAEQREKLVQHVTAIWEALEEDSDFGDELLDRWMKESRALGEILRRIQQENKYQPPVYFRQDESCQVPKEKQELWPVYEYLVRTFCSQLGIHDNNEISLYYTIKESLNELMVVNN